MLLHFCYIFLSFKKGNTIFFYKKKETQLKIRCYSSRHSFLDKMSCHFCSFTCYWISIENMKQNDCGYLAEQCSKKQTNNFSQTTLESFEKVLRENQNWTRILGLLISQHYFTLISEKHQVVLVVWCSVNVDIRVKKAHKGLYHFYR